MLASLSITCFDLNIHYSFNHSGTFSCSHSKSVTATNYMYCYYFFKQKTEPDSSSVFRDGIGEWNNEMAAGMMPLDQEVAAFGDVMPSPNNNIGNNH